MFVKMMQSLGTPNGAYIRGKIYEVDEHAGAQWIQSSLAERSTTPPEYIEQLLDRLDDGAGKPCLFLPPAGIEFGHEVMTPVRLVHFHKASHKVVCCRPGTEVLYPSAAVHITDWIDPIPDAQRVGTCRDREQPQWPDLYARFPEHRPVSVSGFSMAQELYPIEPEQPIAMQPKRRGLAADVALGVRVRQMGAERNWPRERWQCVANAITRAGYTFAVVGRHETSINLDGQEFHTGDYPDTDAAVELLQSCRLFVGSDSGAAHLASTVGAPMLVFRHQAGRTFVERMAMVNPGRVAFMPDAWDDPDAIVARMLRILRSGRPQHARLPAEGGGDGRLAVG